jgi:predicted metal-dependent hydrolase
VHEHVEISPTPRLTCGNVVPRLWTETSPARPVPAGAAGRATPLDAPRTVPCVPPVRRTRADGVEVVRSDRRRRTVSAYRQDGRTVVLLPGRMSKADEERWVVEMLARLERQEARRRPAADGLEQRAADLSERYLDGRAVPASVTWSTRQNGRWGSCTPVDGTIRLSSRLQGMPDWVVDYVLVHELAHLLQPGHDAAFWQLVGRYPKAERARGYLEGVAAATSQ